MFITIITQECFNEIEYCKGLANQRILYDWDWYEQADREGFGETNCDAQLNEYWSYCEKPISEPRFADSPDWDDE